MPTLLQYSYDYRVYGAGNAAMTALESKAAYEARRAFPRALTQLPESFRFAMDSLLLACWLDCRPGERLLDIGTGCGVLSLGMLCRQAGITAIGIEVQAELAATARINAEQLGFSEYFSVFTTDARLFPQEYAALRGTCDCALANPPFRSPDTGRVPASHVRRIALFEEPDTLAAFCRAAAFALKDGGRFGLLYPAAGEEKLGKTLTASGFALSRILPLQSRPEQPPSMLLLEARKQGAASPAIRAHRETPLVIWQGHGAASRMTPEVLAFCPFLA